MTTTAAARVTTHALPWEVMTPRQQAEHLVHAHAMGADFLDLGREEGDPTDALTYWLNTTPEMREDNHDDDHHEYPHGGGTLCLHTHDKAAPSAA